MKYKLSLVLLDENVSDIVEADFLPETGKAYIFVGIEEKPHYIAAVENYDNAGMYRVIEGNPLAFCGASDALKKPAVINVVALH